jgi:hypothetical protein
MRFEVPQFIEVEDKIVGPLTWRQFIYIAGGIGLVIILYVTLPFILFAIFGVPLGALSGFLAFHRINNRPFSAFLESFVNYMRRGKLYFWQREEQTILGYSDPAAHELEKSLPGNGKHLATLAEKLEYYSREREQ